MALVVPNTERAIILADLFSVNLEIRLFSNNITPSTSSVYANFTEVAGGGYAALTLVGGAWNISSGTADYAPQDFHFSGATSGPGTIYGYYIVHVSDTNLILAELFPSPPFTPTAGSLIRITPRLVIS